MSTSRGYFGDWDVDMGIARRARLPTGRKMYENDGASSGPSGDGPSRLGQSAFDGNYIAFARLR